MRLASGIVAIGPEGLIACHVVPGAVNKSIFLDFIQSIVEGGRLSNRTILMDNLCFHKSKEIVDICRTAGVHIQYTPPYSPECNPIENFFSVVKDELREYLKDYSPSSCEAFTEDVHDAVHAASCRVKMENFFEGFLDRAQRV